MWLSRHSVFYSMGLENGRNAQYGFPAVSRRNTITLPLYNLRGHKGQEYETPIATSALVTGIVRSCGISKVILSRLHGTVMLSPDAIAGKTKSLSSNKLFVSSIGEKNQGGVPKMGFCCQAESRDQIARPAKARMHSDSIPM